MPLQFDLGALDRKEISRLMKLLAGTDIEECEIEQGEFRIFVRRAVSADTASVASEIGHSEEQELAVDEPAPVRSPAVGFFYRSERRSGSHEVEPGARVKVGDVLGCIEVMGVPHSVFSTNDGVVEEFLVEDGEPVEYGQPIVAISY